ncbi:hypothetical protein OVA14_12580 [Agrococcus sp. SL85]|uniref:hypothetical protein n=1 Tax=Agrococcus sp. SL85 TaxID=2995141 RepID=UPI00226D2C68|nr:hypothetical protein [Agrococcus sp. SL85]WAC66103.1 hypothetical protein OVA14_12580 [Agrococcus sp. SL85]
MARRPNPMPIWLPVVAALCFGAAALLQEDALSRTLLGIAAALFLVTAALQARDAPLARLAPLTARAAAPGGGARARRAGADRPRLACTTTRHQPDGPAQTRCRAHGAGSETP